MSKIFIFFILALFGFAFLRGVMFLDPDFGWHYQMGRLISESGIPKTDPFSYTMPSYEFIDHEWLSNLFIYHLYETGGRQLLSLIYAVIFIASVLIAIPRKYFKYSLIPAALAGIVILPFEGVRTQVVSWLFLSITLKFLFDSAVWNKYKYFLPLLFIFWVNLHGSFALGIALIGLKLIMSSRFEKPTFFVLASSFLATLINPYGIKIWHEIIMQVGDTGLSSRIVEWQRSFYYPDLAFCLLIALSIVIMIKFWKKFNPVELSIFLFLSFMAGWGVRHVALWAISAIYINSKAFYLLAQEINKNKFNKERFERIKKPLLVTFSLFFLFEAYFTFSVFSITEDKFYPKKAIEYLKNQEIKGEIFGGYNWGGYLIWKLPDKKVFIDGRMPSWRREGSFPGESNNAFADLVKLDDPKFLKETIQKYDIEYFLLSSQETQKNFIIAFLENFLGKKEVKKPDIEVSLKELGFVKSYEDNVGIIYRKNLD